MRADHLVCVRRRVGVGVYSHHGIDLGDGRVVHYTGEPGAKADAAISVTTLEEFAAGDPVSVEEYGHCDAADIVIDRAMSRIGERDYNLVTNNCEHFAVWCKTGESTSHQVRNKGGKSAVTALGGVATATGTVATTAATVGAVSVAGTAGLSAAGITSGLATIGGIVGGGMAAGTAIVVAAPLVGAAAIGAAAYGLVRLLKGTPKKYG